MPSTLRQGCRTMPEWESPLVIHRPAHWKRAGVVCVTCKAPWPCLAASTIAAELVKARAAGDELVTPWWFIPVMEKVKPDP